MSDLKEFAEKKKAQENTYANAKLIYYLLLRKIKVF